MKVSIIVAVAENGVIGDKNALLWHISEDLKRFKALTTGHAVVMGRKTYESLGRPLPNRHNVVITRQEGLQIEGCTVVHSLEEAYALLAHEQEIFIIGGAQIYAEAMAKAKTGDLFYLTRVHHPYVGDTSFPEWDAASWRFLESEGLPCGEKYPYPFTFEAYVRR